MCIIHIHTKCTCLYEPLSAMLCRAMWCYVMLALPFNSTGSEKMLCDVFSLNFFWTVWNFFFFSLFLDKQSVHTFGYVITIQNDCEVSVRMLLSRIHSYIRYTYTHSRLCCMWSRWSRYIELFGTIVELNIYLYTHTSMHIYTKHTKYITSNSIGIIFVILPLHTVCYVVFSFSTRTDIVSRTLTVNSFPCLFNKFSFERNVRYVILRPFSYEYNRNENTLQFENVKLCKRTVKTYSTIYFHIQSKINTSVYV